MIIKTKFISITINFFLIFFSFSNCTKLMGQDSIMFFDKNWNKTNKDSAKFYRYKPLKFETKKTLGFKLKNVDSIYQIKDYYIENDSLQFFGYSIDKDANWLIGKSIWYDKNGAEISTQNNEYRPLRKMQIVNAKLVDFSSYMALNLGYHYIGRGVNSGYFGLDVRATSENNSAFNIGLGTFIVNLDNNLLLLPAIQTNYTLKNNLLLFEISTSNRFFKPAIGFNLLNLIQLKIGYNYWYKNYNLNSINVGLNVCLGGNNFYDYLKIGW